MDAPYKPVTQLVHLPATSIGLPEDDDDRYSVFIRGVQAAIKPWEDHMPIEVAIVPAPAPNTLRGDIKEFEIVLTDTMCCWVDVRTGQRFGSPQRYNPARDRAIPRLFEDLERLMVRTDPRRWYAFCLKSLSEPGDILHQDMVFTLNIKKNTITLPHEYFDSHTEEHPWMHE